MVNMGSRGDNGRMRKLALVVTLGVALAACAGGGGRALQRYYDPRGLFSADLPRENQIQVIQPQGAAGGPQLLTGVASTPPEPSPPPAAASAFGRRPVLGTQFRQQDRTIYVIYAVAADQFRSVEQLSRLHTDDPSADLKVRESMEVGGRDGLLVVADHETDDGRTFTVASTFFIEGDVGFWIAALFPLGDWDRERGDYLRVVSSFQSGVPAGIPAVAFGAGAA